MYPPYKQLAYEVASGRDAVGIEVDYTNSVPRVSELAGGALSAEMRKCWSGFLMDLSMGPILWGDLHPQLRVMRARLVGHVAYFQMTDGKDSRVYGCDLLAHDRTFEVAGAEYDPASPDDYWDGPFPVGVGVELRVNFPHRDPEGPYLFSTVWPEGADA